MDREKVIKGLECCLGSNDCDVEPEEDCPYKGMCLCAMALRFDVFALLKEQEAEISKNSSAYLDLVGKSSKQPETVYCKDCKYWENEILRENHPSWLPCMHVQTRSDFYCADGKRK